MPQELVKSLNMEVASVEQTEKSDLSEIDMLLESNCDFIAAKDKELGFTDTKQMHIQLNDPNPICLRPYRIPMNNRTIIDKSIDEML